MPSLMFSVICGINWYMISEGRKEYVPWVPPFLESLRTRDTTYGRRQDDDQFAIGKWNDIHSIAMPEGLIALNAGESLEVTWEISSSTRNIGKPVDPLQFCLVLYGTYSRGFKQKLSPAEQVEIPHGETHKFPVQMGGYHFFRAFQDNCIEYKLRMIIRWTPICSGPFFLILALLFSGLTDRTLRSLASNFPEVSPDARLFAG